MKIIKYIIILLVAVSISTLAGYYFKKPDALMLRVVSSEKTEWKKDLRIESLKSDIGFFEFKTSKPFIGEDGNQYYTSSGKFLFNWMAFTKSLIGVLLVSFILTKTKLIDVLKSRAKPYLK